MRVYRVERNGWGPYKHPEIRADDTGLQTIAAEHRPMPYRDGLPVEPDHNYRYGFRTVALMKKWFKKEDRKILTKNHFRCRVYEVSKEHVMLGSRQLTFDITKARKLKEIVSLA